MKSCGCFAAECSDCLTRFIGTAEVRESKSVGGRSDDVTQEFWAYDWMALVLSHVNKLLTMSFVSTRVVERSLTLCASLFLFVSLKVYGS